MMFFLFFLWPILEVLLWIQFADVWGWSGNFLEILISGFLGVFLIRRGGLRTLTDVQTAAVAGKSPAGHILRALCYLLGGFLLMLPGVLTDFFGILLVLPVSRHLLAGVLAKNWARTQGVWVHVSSWGPATQGTPPASEDIIDVEARDIRELK